MTKIRLTPKNVTELSMCEIFVFGSNLQGLHHGGAARTAYERFGAEWGVGVGPTGKCYAIPTMHGGVEDIKPYVDDFVEYAKAHPNNRFRVTRIGCGIAGFTDKEIAPLFKKAHELYNVTFPLEWIPILMSDEFIDAVMFESVPAKKKIKIPKALTEDDLTKLCDEYKYIIGAGIIAAPKPEIKIRYVIGQNRFGYADFGDFFFFPSGDLYVWTKNKEFAEDHNQDVVEGYFEDECRGRGYCHRAIFAGVKTPYRDSNGEDIYTGDVLDIDYGGRATFALGTLGWNDKGTEAIYAFALDNCSIIPEICTKMTRIGTTFYQLDWNEDPMTIADRCYRFQPWYPDGLQAEDRLTMSRYTPNFDQDLWKYYACEKLGVEFNWRK